MSAHDTLAKDTDMTASATRCQPRHGRWRLKTSLALATLLLGTQAGAQITFYENDNFRGRTFSTQVAVRDFYRSGFNDRASSVMVEGGRWEACDDSGFKGSCVVLRKGNYPSLREMGLNDRLSSVRPANSRRDAALREAEPAAEPAYAWRRRPDERVYQANVTSVRAVMGDASERCWVEREQLTGRNEPDVGRGVLGAVIGGVLGHQIGGGTGRDLATAGGVVAGAVLGANSGRNRDAGPARDVRRCETVRNSTPAWWDVGYTFRGKDHRLQMSTAPGATISVNSRGEPRQ